MPKVELSFEELCTEVLEMISTTSEHIGNPGFILGNLKHRGVDITVAELEKALTHLHRSEAIDLKLDPLSPNISVLFLRRP